MAAGAIAAVALAAAASGSSLDRGLMDVSVAGLEALYRARRYTVSQERRIALATSAAGLTWGSAVLRSVTRIQP